MGDSTHSKVGDENAKAPDSEMQGTKAGKRNRADTNEGDMPPPTGETSQAADDPRKSSRQTPPSRS